MSTCPLCDTVTRPNKQGRQTRCAEHDTCSVHGCSRPFRAKGFCGGHLKRWNEKGDALPDIPLQSEMRGLSCSVEGCDRKAKSRAMCDKHIQRWRTHGDPAKVHQHAYAPRLNAEGYVTVPVPGEGRTRLQHRVIMESILGRPLLRHETVHHINGDRADNSTGNLELWSSSQPAGQRVADKLSWARQIVELYG